MACNAWNHHSRCNCGWGGVSYGLPNSNPIPSPARTSFTNPNAHCPECGASVFFYRSENGGAAWFDALGWPWPKHPCMDTATTGRWNANGTAPAGSAPASPMAGVRSDDWIPFEIMTVSHEQGWSLIGGCPDQHVATIGVGIMAEIRTARGLPAFIRAKPERRGVVEFTTLDDLEPIVIDGYLDCTELDELKAWEAALEGSPSDQNAVGWRLCFGRARKYTISPGEFTRANWQGGLHWLCLAASGGHASALNNLATDRMMNECGIDRSERDVLRDGLYASAKKLERLQDDDEAKIRKAALKEARALVQTYRSKTAASPASD